MLKHFFLALGVLFSTLGAVAQSHKTVPSLSEIEGDYIVINYKVYEGNKGISDTRAMHLSATDHDSLYVEGFYMKGSIPFRAGYNASTGHISIKSGIKVFDFSDEYGQGTSQFLYAWDEQSQKPIDRPIVYRYKGGGKWEFQSPIVLMTGIEGGELTPYYFSQGSKFVKANATTHNLSYVGYGADQQKWEESRPSYVDMEQGSLTIYNMLQTDAYGYGCWLTFNLSSVNGKLTSEPTIIGQVNNISYPYKALAGCEFDENNLVPTQLVYDGTSHEGLLEGTYNETAGTIELSPMAIWPATIDNNVWRIQKDSFYEFVRSVRITLHSKDTGVMLPTLGNHDKQIVAVEYVDMSGRKIAQPSDREVCIRVVTYDDHTQQINKILFSGE